MDAVPLVPSRTRCELHALPLALLVCHAVVLAKETPARNRYYGINEIKLNR